MLTIVKRILRVICVTLDMLTASHCFASFFIWTVRWFVNFWRL